MGEAAPRTDIAVPVRLAAVFLPAPLPRDGRIAFWDPDGGPLPDPERGPLPTPHGGPPSTPDKATPAYPDKGSRPSADDAASGPSHDPTRLTVVRPHGSGVRRSIVPALTLPIAEALPLLAGARRDRAAHPATACWGAATLHALRLVARGRLLPD